MKESRKSILCPVCRRLISLDEAICPHCGLKSPGLKARRDERFRQLIGHEYVVRNLIIANVAMFLISLLMSPLSSGLSFHPFHALSPSNQSLFLLGATGAIPIHRFHRWWTLLSANYLHGGLLHILFNMLALYQLGPLIIHEYGVSRMFILYSVGGVAGFWVSYMAGVPLTIGASAALCGLIGAALYFGKSRGGLYGETVYRQIGGWALAIILFGFLVPGINNWAHGGGLVAGGAMGAILGYTEKRPETTFHRGLAMILALLTLVTLLWQVLSAMAARMLL
jgi:rhomboid protease GluP